jgi:hypothetical protein
VVRKAWFRARIALVKEVCENAEPSRSSDSALQIHRPVQFRGTGFGASVAPPTALRDILWRRKLHRPTAESRRGRLLEVKRTDRHSRRREANSITFGSL